MCAQGKLMKTVMFYLVIIRVAPGLPDEVHLDSKEAKIHYNLLYKST